MTTTAAKRSASAGFAMPGLVTLPFANGTDDQASRWHGAFCYFLGSEEPAVPIFPSDGWTLAARCCVFQLPENDVIFDSGRMRVWRMKRR